MKFFHCLDFMPQVLFNQDIGAIPLSSISSYYFTAVGLLNVAAQSHASGWHYTVNVMLNISLFCIHGHSWSGSGHVLQQPGKCKESGLHNELGQCLLHYLVLVFTNCFLMTTGKNSTSSRRSHQPGRQEDCVDVLWSQCQLVEV